LKRSSKPCGLYIRSAFLSLGLHPNALLILAEIDQLCKNYASCHAPNRHFRSRFKLSENTVTSAVKALLNKGLIRQTNTATFEVLHTAIVEVETAELAENRTAKVEVKTAKVEKNTATSEAKTAKVEGPSKQEQQEVSNNNKNTGADKPLPYDLPEWLPRETWNAFEEYRDQLAKGRAKAAPLTDRARVMAIAHLDRLRLAGNDPVRVVERTVLSAKWTGFYELPESENRKAGSPAPIPGRTWKKPPGFIEERGKPIPEHERKTQEDIPF
jgi:hypothetical protein